MINSPKKLRKRVKGEVLKGEREEKRQKEGERGNFRSCEGAAKIWIFRLIYTPGQLFTTDRRSCTPSTLPSAQGRFQIKMIKTRLK